jgi:ketosteroid isomerase-like protein
MTPGRDQQQAPALPVSADTYIGVCNTYNRYVQSLDAGDYDSVVECFADDGALFVDGRPERRGWPALRAQFDGRPPGPGHIKHIVGGIWVRADRADTAEITAALVLVDLRDGRIVASGNSDDILRLGTDGSWRFVEKRVSLPWRAP